MLLLRAMVPCCRALLCVLALIHSTMRSCSITCSCFLLWHFAVVPCYVLLLRGTAPCHRAQFHALAFCYGTLVSCPLHVYALRQAPCHRAHYPALIFRCGTLLSCPATCCCFTIQHLALMLNSMLLPFANGTMLSCPFCVLLL